MNTTEFSLRENNTGSFPRGLSLMLRAMASWIYDKDPFQPLRWTDDLAHFKVRRRLIQTMASRSAGTAERCWRAAPRLCAMIRSAEPGWRSSIVSDGRGVLARPTNSSGVESAARAWVALNPTLPAWRARPNPYPISMARAWLAAGAPGVGRGRVRPAHPPLHPGQQAPRHRGGADVHACVRGRAETCCLARLPQRRVNIGQWPRGVLPGGCVAQLAAGLARALQMLPFVVLG
jgi:hypothetical protein